MKNISKNIEKIIDYLTEQLPAQNILNDPESLKKYSIDKTSNLSARPHLVVKIESAAQAALILKIANQYKVPVIPRGSGTGVTGGSLAIKGGIILSLEKMNNIIEIDKNNLLAVVEPGVITGDLQQAVLKKGLFYPPDPASLENCSLGGNAAAAAGGPRAVKYGTTKDYVLGLEFVTPEGKIMKSGGKYVKNSTGYNLAPLIIGSEGTLAVITKLYLRLIPAPRHTFDFLIPFTNIETAIETVFLIIQKKIIPSTIEFMEANTIELVARYKNEAIPFPNAGAHLLVQLDGNSEHEIQLQYKEILNIKNINQQNVITAKTEEERAKIWSIRRSIRDSIEKESPIFFAEDCAVPVSRIPDFVKGVRERLNKIGIHCLIFGHAGDGNVHINILKKNIENSLWKKIKPQARQLIYELAVQNEGTISGEHGIGCLRKDYLHLTFSESEIKLMKEIKKTFDPNNILNPGKIFDI